MCGIYYCVSVLLFIPCCLYLVFSHENITLQLCCVMSCRCEMIYWGVVSCKIDIAYCEYVTLRSLIVNVVSLIYFCVLKS